MTPKPINESGKGEESIKMGKPQVAYFCMEYGVSQKLSLYAGGLGILAGDIVKSAKDLKKPFLAIGILWDEGYSHQHLDKEGKVVDSFRPISRSELIPVDLPEKLNVTIGGKTVELQAFRVQEYQDLYLLEPIAKEDKEITKRLYQGDRIAQEIILGVGGVRLLRCLGTKVDLFHLNEGHAVFSCLELIREYRDAQVKAGSERPSLESAMAHVRKSVVFTTHTPVKAGNETHELKDLDDIVKAMNLTEADLKKIGGLEGEEGFGMTVAGLRLSSLTNGVSKLHTDVAKDMWAAVEGASSIIAVTNGVHCGTWQKAAVKAAAEADDMPGLFKAHQSCKEDLIKAIEKRSKIKMKADCLVIGFARRVVEYKRALLIFENEGELADALKAGRIQLVFSGKAHPNDTAGKKIIARIQTMVKKYPNSAVFLEDYDMDLGALLTSGSDVWLNNPVRPMEACGTSGMKAAMNGVLNLSISDGWWPEGAKHGVNGWVIQAPVPQEVTSDDKRKASSDLPENPTKRAKTGEDNQDVKLQKEGVDEARDDRDSKELHRLIKDEVMPAYYGSKEASASDIGNKKWTGMMKASITMSQHPFSADRMVEDYYETMYGPVWRNETKK
eukprot:Selendium_serpulae@DN665_c0_g1_i1.p1